MRLVGATPRQVSVIAAVEATVATAVGVAAGFAVFFGLRSVLATVPFTGQPFFPGDLSLHPSDIMLVAVGSLLVGRVESFFKIDQLDAQSAQEMADDLREVYAIVSDDTQRIKRLRDDPHRTEESGPRRTHRSSAMISLTEGLRRPRLSLGFVIIAALTTAFAKTSANDSAKMNASMPATSRSPSMKAS